MLYSRVLFSAALLLCNFNLMAANQGTGPIIITKLTNFVGTSNFPNEVLEIETDGLFINPASCSNTINNRYHLGAASTISRSIVLSAHISKAKINLLIWGGGCSPDNRPVVVAVDLGE